MLIGIAGKKKTGKTTLAKNIKLGLSSPSKTAAIYNFAGPLKDEVSTAYDFDRSLCHTDEGKNTVIRRSELVDLVGDDKATVREILQVYGTDLTRKTHPNYWVDALDAMLNDEDFKLIPDVRFENEAGYIKKHGGFLIRLLPYHGWGESDDHLSETELDHYQGFDIVCWPKYGELLEWSVGLTGLIKAIELR